MILVSCRNIRESASIAAEVSNGDDQSSGGGPSEEKIRSGASEFEPVRTL